MKDIEIYKWEEIKDYGWDVLLIGNGASISIYEKFNYNSLFEVAKDKNFLSDVERIFDALETKDFEQVLLSCWYAEKVNQALGRVSDDISEAYEKIRRALISSVYEVHPNYGSVSDDIARAANFSKNFRFVVSLNYDIMFYWAMMKFNEENGSWFKDCFLDGEFETEWEFMREPRGADGATIVFYPHGNLVLARDYIGNEIKISRGREDLLDTIRDSWLSGGCVPIFVCEGRSKEKILSIRRSYYLNHVYENVLPHLFDYKDCDNLVVYGWGFGDQDDHIIDAIFKKGGNGIKNIAISVFSGVPDNEQMHYCRYVIAKIRKFELNAEICFFDAQSNGCWNNPR